MLFQTDVEGNERVVSFASRTLYRVERNYSVTERRYLSVIWAVQKSRGYLGGLFMVIIDHQSLIYLNKLKDCIGRLVRWYVCLQQFDFVIQHRKGTDNVVPDLMSRASEAKISLIQVGDDVRDRWYFRQ